ncbi:MAG: hypothetical protein R3F41_19070 [Gammaproteobacteria bacterium]
MKVTAWNNGSHHSTGAGYGFKIKIEDRDAHFDRSWGTVEVELPTGEIVESNIAKDSFWGAKCRELIDQQFGIWLLDRNLAPWQKGSPPVFELEHISGNRFRLSET